MWVILQKQCYLKIRRKKVVKIIDIVLLKKLSFTIKSFAIWSVWGVLGKQLNICLRFQYCEELENKF